MPSASKPTPTATSSREESICRKSRLTFADRRSKASQAAVSYYSACVSSSSSRLISQLAVESGALQHTVDVSGAYYKDTRPSPADGSHLVFARIPVWLSTYGEFPTHSDDGSPNYIRITGNMVGCADAGCIWEAAYDKHLIEIQGMTQSVYDTRVFYKKTPDGFVIAHVHVDDTRITASSLRDLNAFYDTWASDLDEERKPRGKPLSVNNLDKTFAGIRYHFSDRFTCTLSCTCSIDQLKLILNDF